MSSSRLASSLNLQSGSMIARICGPRARPELQPQRRHFHLTAASAAASTDSQHAVGSQPLALTPVSEEFRSGERQVKLIFSDVDGTLLDSRQQLTPGVQRAVRAAAEAGVPLVTITGKAMGPWRQDVHPYLGSRMPQVYIQGLLITDPEGRVLHSRQLETSLVQDAVAFAREHGLSLTAYLHDRIVCEARDDQTDRLIFYKEPTPEAIGPLEPHVGQLPFMKLIFMSSEQRIAEIRPAAEALYAGRASLTTAIGGMLEVLPLGASKAAAVEVLLKQLGVDRADCMALGDGENDKEMLAFCGLGVAMGHANPAALAVADAVTLRNDEDGVARAIEEFVLAPRGLHYRER